MGQVASSTVQPPPPDPPAVSIPPVPSEIYLLHTTLNPRPKLILFGDSITEQGSSHAQGWVTSLTIRYNRRLDVVNRGLSGYNTRWGAAALPLILEETLGSAASSVAVDGQCTEPDSESRPPHSDNVGEFLSDDDAQTRQRTQHYPQYTFVIGFGANDSCLPDGPHSRHHVQIEDYSHNLQRMIRLIQTWNTEKIAVVLMTPPPCDTDIQMPSRDNDVTKLYAEACQQVASDMNLPVVDLWNGMQLPIAQTNDGPLVDSSHRYKQSGKWKEFLNDGLHLTARGNYRLYELVIEILEGSLGLSVANLPRSYPCHSMVDAAMPQKSFDNKVK